MSFAVPRIVCRTRSLLKYGNIDHTAAAAPETNGAANDVPWTRYALSSVVAFGVVVPTGDAPMTYTAPGADRQ